jgi:AraC family transcriptional regulator
LNASAKEAYRARFVRVLRHIDANLDQDLSLEALSAVAAFSRFHFHRQFSALVGVGVHDYVRRRRMKRAAYWLAYRPDTPVLEIALDSGYASPEAFTRAFRGATGQTPTGFRAAPAWEPWLQKDDGAELMTNDADPTLGPVEICAFPGARVAVLEHRGDPARLGETIRRFIAWRKANAARPPASATYNILHADPHTTPPADFRLDLCAGVTGSVAHNSLGVRGDEIPPMRCAVLRHVGAESGLERAIEQLYREWLPESGEEPGDHPPFLQRIRFFPDVPELEAITDIHIPLA